MFRYDSKRPTLHTHGSNRNFNHLPECSRLSFLLQRSLEYIISRKTLQVPPLPQRNSSIQWCASFIYLYPPLIGITSIHTTISGGPYTSPTTRDIAPPSVQVGQMGLPIRDSNGRCAGPLSAPPLILIIILRSQPTRSSSNQSRPHNWHQPKIRRTPQKLSGSPARSSRPLPSRPQRAPVTVRCQENRTGKQATLHSPCREASPPRARRHCYECPLPSPHVPSSRLWRPTPWGSSQPPSVS